MKFLQYSKLSPAQKKTISIVIGFKDKIPITFAKNRGSLGWDIMQHRDKSILSKNKDLLTITIKDSLKDVISYFNKHMLFPYFPVNNNIENQEKKKSSTTIKNRRKYPRKTINLSGFFLNTRTKLKSKLFTQNISVRGIQFKSKSKHQIMIGDILLVNFTLKNNKQSHITREVKAVHIDNKIIGGEIINPPPFEPELGFYLMQ